MSPRRLAHTPPAPGPAAPGPARRFLEDTCPRPPPPAPRPPAPGRPARARRFVEDPCRRWRAAELAADAALVISELVTNAVRHAGTEVRVALELRDGRLTVSVHDRGPGLPHL